MYKASRTFAWTVTWK